MKTKVLIITAKDEFELVKKFNEDERQFFATQPIEKLDKTWVMFCYYNSQTKNTGDTQKTTSDSLESREVSSVSNENTGSRSDTFSKNLATKSQLDYIYKNELDVNTENLTKQEAWKLIKEHKEMMK
jgi:hypothetical protein